MRGLISYTHLIGLVFLDMLDIIDKYYPEGSLRREIFMRHAVQVADKAIATAIARNLDIDLDKVRTAAMLHDIGICLTNAPDIGCFGDKPYITHGILGADLLRNEGFNEIYANVAERHTGAGLTKDDIISQNLPLPHQDFCPQTLLERLICYADKFYSKSGEMKEKTIDNIRRSMARHSVDTLNRWIKLEQEFYPDN